MIKFLKTAKNLILSYRPEGDTYWIKERFEENEPFRLNYTFYLSKEDLIGDFEKSLEKGRIDFKLGEIDGDDYLTITGRVKEIFKTSKGKYISPVPIESKLHPQISVDHFCVTGANLPHPIGIANYLKPWTKENKKQLEKEIFTVLTNTNRQLEAHERINLILVVNEDWTTDNGMMTPTLKIRRQQIDKRYAKVIEQNPSSKKISVVWCDPDDFVES